MEEAGFPLIETLGVEGVRKAEDLEVDVVAELMQ